MAASHGSHNSAVGLNVTSLGVTLTGVTSTSAICVGTTQDNGNSQNLTSSPSMTWITAATTPLDNIINTNAFLSTWYALNAASGSITITQTPVGSNNMQIIADEFLSVATASAIDGHAQATFTSTSTPSGAPVTTTNADDALWGIVYTDSGTSNAITATGAWTLSENPAAVSNQCVAAEWQIVSSTGTRSPAFSLAGGAATGALCQIALKAADAGGATAARVPQSRPFPYKPGSPPGLR